MLKSFVKEEIKKGLKDMEGMNIYLGDLSFKVFESEYNNKSYTCNSYESIQWIKDYFEELDEIVEEYESEYGDNTVPNPIVNPEKFQLIIITYVADLLITDAIYNVGLEIDDEIELSKKVIDEIIEVL